MHRHDLILGSAVVGDMRKRDPQPWLVDDDLWARIELLLPKQPTRSGPGRRPVDDRKVLGGILFVLFTGIRWEWLPGELGFGCGMMCWRRLRDWNNAERADRLPVEPFGAVEVRPPRVVGSEAWVVTAYRPHHRTDEAVVPVRTLTR
jgi:putative transposase of IS4/5 family DUF4096